MRIFNFFKKKKTDTTFPENDLEQVLMKAVKDALHRKEFYTKLLWSELYLLTDGHHKGVKYLEKGTTVNLIIFKTGQIPVFTSANRIFDKGINKGKVPYIVLKGQNLFALAKGATFILNPYSDYGRELDQQEIAALMNGKIFQQDLWPKEDLAKRK